MNTDDEIEVQLLRAARVHVVRADPGKLVLQMTGVTDTYFLMATDELAALAERLAADARLLSTGNASGTSPS